MKWYETKPCICGLGLMLQWIYKWCRTASIGKHHNNNKNRIRCSTGFVLFWWKGKSMRIFATTNRTDFFVFSRANSWKINNWQTERLRYSRHIPSRNNIIISIDRHTNNVLHKIEFSVFAINDWTDAIKWISILIFFFYFSRSMSNDQCVTIYTR